MKMGVNFFRKNVIWEKYFHNIVIIVGIAHFKSLSHLKENLTYEAQENRKNKSDNALQLDKSHALPQRATKKHEHWTLRLQ